MSADSPVTLYAIKQSNGKLGRRVRSSIGAVRLAGEEGFGLHAAMQKALEHLIESGDYKTIATNWGVERGHDRQTGDQRRRPTESGFVSMSTDDSPPPGTGLRHARRDRCGSAAASLALVTAIVVLVLAALFLYGAATNPAYRWPVFGKYLFLDERIVNGASW